MLSRKWKPLRNYVRRVADKGAWKEKKDDFETFGWKPQPEVRQTSKYDERQPRYELVDMPENWSPYKWSGINRPANKKGFRWFLSSFTSAVPLEPVFSRTTLLFR
jgi:hypothetical protein